MTWSLIVLDTQTKEIGVAGASCSGYVAGIEGTVPGKGVIIAQAMSNMQAKERGMDLIRAGESPEAIIATITDPQFDPTFADQQYAVVTFAHLDTPATFTGANTAAFAGAISGKGFSIQGNILTSEAVLQATHQAVEAAIREGCSLAETIMRGLEAGGIAGGDRRCGEQRATSAFVTVVRPDDSPWHPYLHIVIHGVESGGANAVSLVRTELDRWRTTYQNNASTQLFVKPASTAG